MESEQISRLSSRLNRVKRIFLDTAPVIYYVEENRDYFNLVEIVFKQVDAAVLTAITSPITLAECLVLPYRLGLPQLQTDFLDLIVDGVNTIFIPIDEIISQKAAQLRAAYNITLTDALQVSTALKAGCEVFLTNDAQLKEIPDTDIIVLSEV